MTKVHPNEQHLEREGYREAERERERNRVGEQAEEPTSASTSGGRQTLDAFAFVFCRSLPENVGVPSSDVTVRRRRPNFGVVGGRYPIYREKSIFICIRPVGFAFSALLCALRLVSGRGCLGFPSFFKRGGKSGSGWRICPTG